MLAGVQLDASQSDQAIAGNCNENTSGVEGSVIMLIGPTLGNASGVIPELYAKYVSKLFGMSQFHVSVHVAPVHALAIVETDDDVPTVFINSVEVAIAKALG